MVLPDWLPGRTLYHLHSLGAAGVPRVNPDVDAAGPSGHGFTVLQRWLDHVVSLGCGGVLLTPVFVSESHGYDTVDPFRIDQRLGDDADFDAFVAAAHERQLRVVLDGVFNHVGRQFGPFRDVVARREASAYADWFRLDFSRDDGDGFAYKCFEGHRQLVGLNHRSAAVLDWAESVALHWLDRGADGWRLDAAYAIPLPFLAQLTARIHAHRPGAFVFGEIIHGDYASFVEAAGLHSATQYELHKAIWSSLSDGNFFELAWALERHRRLSAAFPPVTFAGNHDVTRLAAQLASVGHVPHALAVLFTLPGLPCVYYGDEFAWRAVKEQRPGGDDAIRPALPARAEPSGEEEAWVLGLHHELIALRRARSWLTSGDVEVEKVTNHAIAFVCTSPNGRIRTALDVDCGGLDAPAGWTPVFRSPGVLISEG